MTATQIRGSTQIQSGTITADRFVSSLGLASSQLADGANFIKRDGSVAFTGVQDFGANLPTSSGTPSAANQLVTKSYADAIKSGFRLHFARVVAIANSALTGLLTIDGVTLVAGDIVLLTAQTAASQNGLWTAAAGSWTRPADWAAASTLTEGQYIIIDADGTTYKNTKWFDTNTANVVVDTTAATFIQDASGTSYSGSGVIALGGTVFSLNMGQGVENDGSNLLRVKLSGASLARGTAGISIAPGTAGQVPVTNAGATDVTMVSLSGDATMAASGALTINHTAGSGFLKYTDFIANETPAGSTNGTNVTFTLANTPQVSSLDLLLNGETLEPGAGNDYTITGATVTMLSAPLSGDKLRSWYLR